MTTRRFFTLAGAVAALAAGPALADREHGTQPTASTSASLGIAEGTLRNGVRTVEMKVTEDGFEPSKIKASKGEKVRLVVTRKTDRTCAKEIVIKDHGINQPLPLDKAVTVEFTPRKSGEIRYACGMDMITGIVFVR